MLIEHVGTYRKENIVKALCVTGVASAKAEVSIPTANTTNFPTGKLNRCVVKIGLQSGEVDALLANYTTHFKRDIVIELPMSSSATTEAEVSAAFAAAFTGLQEWPVGYNTTTKKVYAKSPYVTIQIDTETFTGRTTTNPVPLEGTWAVKTAGTVAKGTRGFGNYEQMVSNHRLPTMENIRPWGEAIEEYPVRGTLYTLVELTYVADRNIGGFDVLGQKATSVTTHRFWIPATETAKINLLKSIAQDKVTYLTKAEADEAYAAKV